MPLNLLKQNVWAIFYAPLYILILRLICPTYLLPQPPVCCPTVQHHQTPVLVHNHDSRTERDRETHYRRELQISQCLEFKFSFIFVLHLSHPHLTLVFSNFTVISNSAPFNLKIFVKFYKNYI